MGLCAPRFASPRCVCRHTHSTKEGMCVSLLNHVRLFVTPWTVAHQTPLSREFSRQEYWSGFAISSLQEIIPTQGLNLCLLLHWQAGSLLLSHLGSQRRAGCVIWRPLRYCLRMRAKSASVVSDSLPTRLFCPWGFSSQEYWSALPCLSVLFIIC